VSGNYLKPSIEAAGLDPANLPTSDASKMSFGSGSDSESKAWKDIWGCGQGIGAVKSIQTTQALVDRLSAEYDNAKIRLA
jgi:nitronate monooxygenase